MQTNTIAAPPTVQIGGRPYHVRYSTGAFYLLSTWGIDVTAVAQTLNDKFQNGHYTEAMYKLAAAGLGTIDKEGDWETLGIEPLKLADRLKDGEAAALMEVVWREFSGKLGLVTTTAGTAPAPLNPSTETPGSGTGPLEPAPQA